ncbi:NAD(P)H-dependent oxidoreductase [Paenibacillus protaetiae]|uniref:Flavodoxin family protein n=1 Tax=Paenibacillus protaetiae TaxID=2509456 RepID=A0A4V0YFJ2_9BACL|nr:NAD(P)H-dependent oxidoreductase [Paenibacillus protaetiae]QAY67901.1 flavodoxin family protein [Paenibacillus protaetiae]
MKVYVVYDSESGHTEALARSVADGARTVDGAEVILRRVDEADPRDLADVDAILWGCAGHFGTVSSGLKEFIDRLGYLWAQGKLVGKVGGVFCTIATLHGGLEATLLSLIVPMLHQGMIVVGLPGNIPENALYGSYYGVGIVCPVEQSRNDPLNLPHGDDLVLGKALGRRVTETAHRLKSARY